VKTPADGPVRIQKTNEGGTAVRVLRLEDAIADRIAAFLHWSDSESLDVAERSIAAARDRLTWERVDAALLRLDTSTKESAQRMAFARDRLRRALAGR
jgi:ActR/RegA family two-component response regulator